MKYQSFNFKSYEFNASTKTLLLHYSYDDTLQFIERFKFDFDFAWYDPLTLDRALQQLFFIAGVSYYKMFIAPEVRVESGQIDTGLKSFLDNTYQRGLGEFWYVNKLDPRTLVNFPTNVAAPLPQLEPTSADGLLIGIGGGKDSLVSVELLRSSGLDVATWSLNHRPQLAPLIKRIGLTHYWVEREWDPQISKLNASGAYNGHVPISAIIAAAGTIVAILSGRRDQIVSNEHSANDPTLQYRGVDINHQYSKSQEFEQNYQNLLLATFGESVRYYSLLRPLSELRIAELFAVHWFDKYHDVFSSCNHAFVHSSNHIFWDGTCPKCAFIYLALTPFLPADKVQALFSGKNLLLDASLEPTYRQLLGIEGDKPLECVGEVKESRAAMREAQKTFPELNKYKFELPNDYDYKTTASHLIPPEIWSIVQPQIRA